MESASAEAQRAHPSVLAQITEEMVRIYKDQFGRGPTTARTDFAGPDAVLCTLENTFTPAERNLAVMTSISVCVTYASSSSTPLSPSS